MGSRWGARRQRRGAPGEGEREQRGRLASGPGRRSAGVERVTEVVAPTDLGDRRDALAGGVRAFEAVDLTGRPADEPASHAAEPRLGPGLGGDATTADQNDLDARDARSHQAVG